MIALSIKELDNLVKIGKLKAEAANQVEFDGLLQLGLTYNAAHSLSLAALRWHGYRPINTRYLVFQTLAHTLAVEPNQLRVLDDAHRKRNLSEYEGIVVDLDEALVEALMRITRFVANKVKELGRIKG